MAKTTAQIREEQRKKNVELGLLPQEKDVSELYGAKSFDGREVLPGEKSGETKAREDRFRGHVYDWRKDPGYQDLIEGKGAKVSDIPAIEQSYLEKYPNVPTGNSAIKTEGLSDYNPPKASSTATGVQNQLRKALYDISYLKDSLGASMNETESVRKGVGAGQEQSVVDQERSKVRKKGEDFGITTDRAEGGKTIANPEFTALTTNQKILNAQRQENKQSFIPDSISAESGRAPIKDKLSKENRLSAQQLSQTVNTLGDDSLKVLSANFDLLSPSQKAAARDFLNTKAQGNMLSLVQEISENVKEELTIQEQKIRADLNMSPEDVLTFTDDGEPLINKKTVTQDATDRAKEDVQEAKDDWLETNGEAQENELARITAANTVNGNLTDDGRVELAEQARKYKKIKDKQFEDFDDNLQEFENKQKSRQADVDLAVAKGNSVEGRLNRKLAQDKATTAFRFQISQAKKGREIGFSAAIKAIEKMEKEDAKDPTFADMAKIVDAEWESPDFQNEDMYSMATSQFNGNTNNTEKYMKSRGFLDSDIKAQKQEYQKNTLGYTEDQIRETTEFTTVKDIITRQVAGEDISMSDLNYIADYEGKEENKRRVEQLRVGLENPTLNDNEVFLMAEANIEAEELAEKNKGKAPKVDKGALFTEANDAVSLEFDGDGDPEDISIYLNENYPGLGAGKMTSIIKKNSTGDAKTLSPIAENVFNKLKTGELTEEALLNDDGTLIPEVSDTNANSAILEFRKYKKANPSKFEVNTTEDAPKEKGFFGRTLDKAKGLFKSDKTTINGEGVKEDKVETEPEMTQADFDKIFNKSIQALSQ